MKFPTMNFCKICFENVTGSARRPQFYMFKGTSFSHFKNTEDMKRKLKSSKSSAMALLFQKTLMNLLNNAIHTLDEIPNGECFENLF